MITGKEQVDSNDVATMQNLTTNNHPAMSGNDCLTEEGINGLAHQKECQL